MAKKRDKNVYLLGAGFSADAGIPLMSGFLRSAREYYEDPGSSVPRHLDAHYSAVLDYRQKAKQCRDIVDLDLNNIETLFSMIEMSSILGSADESITASVAHLIAHTVSRTQRIDRKVRVLIPQTILDEASGAEALSTFLATELRGSTQGCAELVMGQYDFVTAVLAGLFDKPAKARSDVFVSFNYDVVLETSLNSLGLRPDYAVTRTKSKQTNKFKQPIKVLKLHGSSNWAYINKKGLRAEIFDSYHEFAQSNEPILVPPTWRKGEFSELIQEAWRAAYTELADANRICVIGYSMPITDAHFKFLMATTLSENPDLYRFLHVDVAGPTADEARERFRGLFAPLVAYNRFTTANEGLAGFIFKQQYKELGRGVGIKRVEWE